MWPTLLHLGPITLKTYGLMMALAFLAGGAILKRGLKNRGLPEALADQILWMSLLSGILGSRLLYIASNPASWREFFFIWQGGLSFLGGLAGAAGACLVYLRLKKIPLAPVTDAAAVALPASHAIGRLGCLAAGCCWGHPTASIFGIKFSHPDCVLPQELLGVRLHPTQLYEAVGLGVIVLIVSKLQHRFSGRLLGVYILLYSLLRFGLEFLRADASEEPRLGPLTFTQAVIVLAGVPLAAAWTLRKIKT